MDEQALDKKNDALCWVLCGHLSPQFGLDTVGKKNHISLSLFSILILGMGDIKKQVFLKKLKQTSRWCAGHRGNQAFDEEVVYLVILCTEFWLQQKFTFLF